MATVLTIDDSPVILKQVEVLCKKIDPSITVLQAKGGEAGLEVFQKNLEQIDICLLDYNMPDLNGLEVAEKIKAMAPEFKNLWMLTANIQAAVEEKIVSAGLRMTPKPVSEQKLRDMLQLSI